MVKSWNAWKISHVTWTWPKFPPRLHFFSSKKMFKTTVAGTLDDSRDSIFSMYGILCLHVGDLCWANVGVHSPGPWFALEGILLGIFKIFFSLGIPSNRRTTPAKVRFPSLKQPHFWGSNCTYYILIDLRKNRDKKQSKLYSLEYHPIL